MVTWRFGYVFDLVNRIVSWIEDTFVVHRDRIATHGGSSLVMHVVDMSIGMQRWYNQLLRAEWRINTRVGLRVSLRHSDTECVVENAWTIFRERSTREIVPEDLLKVFVSGLGALIVSVHNLVQFRLLVQCTHFKRISSCCMGIT